MENASRHVLLIALAALLAACTREVPRTEAPRPVLTMVVGAARTDSSSAYSGEVRARYENDLAFRVGGKVVSRQADVGTSVKKGALLARLDPQDAQLSVEAARAQVAAAEADHSLARSELERYRALREKNFVSPAVLDAKENAFNASRARLEEAQAQLGVSRNQSAYTALYADSNGIITAVNVEPGQVVAAGQAVFRFARPEEKEIVINVPESRLAEAREAREALVGLWANPGKPFRGRVREISPNADPATRTFTVKVSILDSDASVSLGMTASVFLVRDGQVETALLPLSALTQLEGKPAVWVVDPKTRQVKLRAVEVGDYREDGATLRSGLARGEIVVTAGVHKLLANQTVALAEGSEAARVASVDTSRPK